MACFTVCRMTIWRLGAVVVAALALTGCSPRSDPAPLAIHRAVENDPLIAHLVERAADEFGEGISVPLVGNTPIFGMVLSFPDTVTASEVAEYATKNADATWTSTAPERWARTAAITYPAELDEDPPIECEVNLSLELGQAFEDGFRSAVVLVNYPFTGTSCRD
jgi:hypothetical protein